MPTALFAALPGLLKAVPVTIAGVEYLYKEASSTTKQQLAKDSLMVLLGIGSTAVPGTADVAAQLNNVLGAAIDLAVSEFNQLGTFTKKAA